MRFFATYAQLLLHVGTKCGHSLFHLCGRYIAVEDFDFEQATFVKSLGQLRQNGVFVLTPHADGTQQIGISEQKIVVECLIRCPKTFARVHSI